MAKKPSLMDTMAEELKSPAKASPAAEERREEQKEASGDRRSERWRVYETAAGEPTYRHTFYLTQDVKDALDDELRRRKTGDPAASGTQIVREALRAYLIEHNG